MQTLILLPILIPLAGMLVNAAFGGRIGGRAAGLIATVAVAASFGISVVLFAQVAATPARAIGADFGPWIRVSELNVPYGFRVDALSATMMLIITGIGGLIHLYSIGYMKGDPRTPRFFVYLNLFVASMLTLVMADSFLLMFVGWELVGLCSYLLIGFWFTDIKNAEAGRKAFVVNRIGDVAFVLGLLLIFFTFGSLSYGEVFEKAEAMKGAAAGVLTVITLLLFVGAAGKSAQLPLFVWLPDAMAGPTPVSALIHAATMVTAGIYMLIRSNVLLEHAPIAMQVIAIVGALTAFVAGYAALTQWDIKKVLAYSTISQLGFMVAGVGVGAFVASQFHLLTHAFFKALLFLAAGSVIHGMEHRAHETGQHGADPQDMRNMGGLRAKMPLTTLTFILGGLALAGIPPLAGFWSKDEIIAAAAKDNPIAFALLGLTAVFTAFYVGRQIFLVFFGKPRSADAEHAVESAPTMTIPLIALAVFAVLGGLINLPKGFPGEAWLGDWLAPVVGKEPHEPLNLALAGVFVALAVAAIAGAVGLYRRFASADSVDPLTRLGPLYAVSSRKWYLDEIYRAVIIKPFYMGASFLARIFELGGIDGIVNGAGRLATEMSETLRELQTGFARTYGLVMLMGAVAILVYFLVSGTAR
ncbi:MAG TPA: NADH-quinone oxidoreductase subunit L [Thermoflexales bacterium]|nr:NADH-quinone oxidoreductase subunit L [Anaerolineae bacterium]HQV26550.1 NADH-quinone oxidoreductase subunit L [Thermoflexales bacterium]HQZ51933.1 NADH-quinone oxidoreductase subunit L [Thermoflexales bacterium]HRA54800.1 NADH-quinone oxidoreductase subunit L [Thermoflexales bacterium]